MRITVKKTGALGNFYKRPLKWECECTKIAKVDISMLYNWNRNACPNKQLYFGSNSIYHLVRTKSFRHILDYKEVILFSLPIYQNMFFSSGIPLRLAVIEGEPIHSFLQQFKTATPHYTRLLWNNIISKQKNILSFHNKKQVFLFSHPIYKDMFFSAREFPWDLLSSNDPIHRSNFRIFLGFFGFFFYFKQLRIYLESFWTKGLVDMDMKFSILVKGTLIEKRPF